MSSIRVFQTFMHVARLGSFAAASEHVALTAAAVGLQIQTLESDLGYPLFDRIGKTINLNQRGHQLLPRARQLLMLYESMHSKETDQINLIGSIKVASIATSMCLLVGAVLTMRKDHPDLLVEPGISYSGDLLTRVKDGDIDAAVSVKNAHKTPAGVIATNLYREPLAFISSSRTPGDGDLARLLSERLFLRVSRLSKTGAVIDEFMRRKHLKPKEFFEMNAMRTLVDLVREDMGVTILPIPRGSHWETDPSLRITFFDDPQAYRTIGLIENESRSVLTSVLRNYLVDAVADARAGVDKE